MILKLNWLSIVYFFFLKINKNMINTKTNFIFNFKNLILLTVISVFFLNSELLFNFNLNNVLFFEGNSIFFSEEVSTVNTEIVARRVGSGLATAGLGGVGTGIGLVFSGLIKGFSRNPSLKDELFSYAIFGFALTEAIGLFALMMAFMLLYA